MSSFQRPLFIINPVAGDNNKSNAIQHIQEQGQKYNWHSLDYETTGKNDVEQLNERIAKDAPDCLVAYGGDGTVNMVSKLASEHELPMGILPGGSANGLAAEFGLPDDLIENLHIIGKGHVNAIDLIYVNSQPCLHFSDMGLNAKLVKRFNESSFRGWGGYVSAFMDTIREHQPQPYCIKTAEKEVDIEATALVVANARMFGTGAVFNPNGQMNDGLFEICIFKPVPWHEIPTLTWKMFAGDPGESPYLQIIKTKEANISVQKPSYLSIDGEYMGEAEELQISMKHKALKLILPS